MDQIVVKWVAYRQKKTDAPYVAAPLPYPMNARNLALSEVSGKTIESLADEIERYQKRFYHGAKIEFVFGSPKITIPQMRRPLEVLPTNEQIYLRERFS